MCVSPFTVGGLGFLPVNCMWFVCAHMFKHFTLQKCLIGGIIMVIVLLYSILFCFILCHTHLLVHGWQVPHVTDEGPAGHHPQNVTDHAILRTVPEGISKLWVILRKDKQRT